MTAFWNNNVTFSGFLMMSSDIEERKEEEKEASAEEESGVPQKASVRKFQDVVKELAKSHNAAMEKVDLQPISKRVLYPSHIRTVTKVPVIGGEPISKELAQELRRFTFGCSDLLGPGLAEWTDISFSFGDPNSSRSWTLNVANYATQGLVLCLQGYILKHVIFSRRRKGLQAENINTVKVDASSQEEALSSSISDMLWKAGDRQHATLVLPQENVIVTSSEQYVPDGVTEKLHLFHFKKQEELTFSIKKYLYEFTSEGGYGVLICLYSLLLSRGIERILKDLEKDNFVVVQTNGSLQPAIALLGLLGKATNYLHNGIIYEGSEASMARPITGILLRAEIGYLEWSSRDINRSRQVGSRLKTPTNPVWLTNCNGNYGILFNPNKELMRDYHAENRFKIIYYSGNKAALEGAVLTVDSRETVNLDPQSSPPLEFLIHTKWQGSKIDWGDLPPFL